MASGWSRGLQPAGSGIAGNWSEREYASFQMANGDVARRSRDIEYGEPLSEAAIEKGAHRRRVGGRWQELGSLQLDFMVAQGLQPQHRLLDVGCGALRGGVR